MRNFVKTLNKLMEGNKVLFYLSFLAQLFMGFMQVFETFLLKVLVDTLEGIDKLNEAAAFERFVIWILTGGKGNQYLVDNGSIILPVAVIIGGLVLALATFLRIWIRTEFSAKMNQYSQYLLFYHISRLPYVAFKENKEGDLLQTCTRDIDTLKKFIGMDLSQITWTIYMLLFCGVILFSISWKQALMSISLFPILFIYSALLTAKVRKLYRATDDCEATLTDRVSENLASVRIVKAFNNETYEISSFRKYLDEYRDRFIKWRRFSAFFVSSSDIFVFASKVMALISGIWLIYEGEINGGTLVVSILYVNMMVWPVRDSAQCLANMGQNFAASDRVSKLLSIPLENLEEGDTPSIKGDIVFDHVSFAYPDGDVDSIHDVSFEAKSGETIAIMGKTGSGKSTLILLLTRLYDYNSGSIKIDGEEIRDISKKHLRKNVASVLQDPFLFSRSIEDNIRIAKPEASKQEVKLASRNADIDNTIEAFKEGYMTRVGEKGVTLSGGQKQRVAIARSLIIGSPIIIFDDSLSAVDTETDYRIRKNLRENASGSTTFIITHRVSSAKGADKIILMDEGRIVEMGTHEELLAKKNGVYSHLAKIQGKMGMEA